MTTLEAPSQPARGTPGPVRLTRADVAALGRGSRPWDYLTVAARALDLAPLDHELRFLAAANLGKLGLRDAAEGQLGLLPEGVRQDPGVMALRDVLGKLPSEEISHGELISTCGRNLAVLQSRGVLKGVRTDEWVESLRSWRICRTVDGNIVRYRAGETKLSAWRGLHEQFVSARGVVQQHTSRSVGFQAPLVVEGADPPWLLAAAARATPMGGTGHQARIYLVQADINELLDGLALAELADVLSEERLVVLVGPDAAERLGALFREAPDAQLPAGLTVSASLRARTAPTALDVLQSAVRAQESRLGAASADVQSVYSGRDESWWARRYADALAGGEKLRVLIPTSRFSTFIVHSAGDIAAAVRRAGHEARVLVEPDNHSLLTTVAYQRALAEFKPDLVILINFPRAQAPGAFPPNVPFVCWLQDPLPHLLDANAGRAQGRFDFLVGHMFPELFSKFEYPTERALPLPVVACGEKFSSRPADRSLVDKHACEIAFVSHHSQTSDSLHGERVAQTAHTPAIVSVFERLRPRLQGLVGRAMETPLSGAIATTVREEMRAVLGREPDERSFALVMRTYANPMVDRVMRHEALAWAGAIAQRRNWRLHIYGKGWDAHPTLGAFARGPLAHGDELRAAYQAASVHLHVSLTTLVHQRVLECALAGGLPLCRMHRDAIAGFKARAQLACLATGGPDAVDDPAGRIGYLVSRAPEAVEMEEQLRKLGYETDGYCWIARKRAENLVKFARVNDSKFDAEWLLGDLSQATFWSPETLEGALDRAINTKGWRDEHSGAIASRVRSELTYDSAVQRILAMVRESLGASRKE